MSEFRTFRYAAVVDDVHDGDTITLRIDLGFHTWTVQPIRVRGINCPELNTPAGKAARDFVDNLLAEQGNVVDVESFRDRRSFARWVGDIWLPDGRRLADVILDAGHADIFRP